MDDDTYEDNQSALAGYNVAASAGRPRVAYLAGTGVSRDDATLRGETLKEICSRFKMEGLWPFDKTEGLSALNVYGMRTEMIRRADVIIADISPFRDGAGLDSSTAWEIGFAMALRKPTYAYTGADAAEAGNSTPAENLMVAIAVIGPFGSAEEAVRAAYNGTSRM